MLLLRLLLKDYNVNELEDQGGGIEAVSRGYPWLSAKPDGVITITATLLQRTEIVVEDQGKNWDLEQALSPLKAVT